MRYGTDVKQTVLEKLLRPDGPGVPALSSEYGIPTATLYGWVRLARNGRMSRNGHGVRTLREKQATVLEARRQSDEELGRWLREKGLHEAQLKRWEQEIESALAAQEERPARDREHERQLKELEREVRRKDKALAEMSALIVLKKKLEAMWDREEREP